MDTKDSKRLDWLSKQFQRVDEDTCRQSVHVGLLGVTFETGTTLREAVDAAMQSASAEAPLTPGLQSEADEPRFTSRKPFVFGSVNAGLLKRKEGCGCSLCGKKFKEGDGARWIYCNSTPGQRTGNFFVCAECDNGNDSDIMSKAKADLEAAKSGAKRWGLMGDY